MNHGPQRTPGARRLYYALMGAGNTPLWASILNASEMWGVPPWELTGETDPSARAKWLFRLFVYTRERDRARKNQKS